MTDTMTDWPFDQPPGTAAITTVRVIEEDLPILLVTHYADDHSWAFDQFCRRLSGNWNGVRVIARSNPANHCRPTARLDCLA